MRIDEKNHQGYIQCVFISIYFIDCCRAVVNAESSHSSLPDYCSFFLLTLVRLAGICYANLFSITCYQRFARDYANVSNVRYENRAASTGAYIWPMDLLYGRLTSGLLRLVVVSCQLSGSRINDANMNRKKRNFAYSHQHFRRHKNAMSWKIYFRLCWLFMFMASFIDFASNSILFGRFRHIS